MKFQMKNVNKTKEHFKHMIKKDKQHYHFIFQTPKFI